MLSITIALIISYLIGSVPTAYIFGRLLKGVDIRSCGSGNVGATNALRVLGKPAGITVLILDILKGFVCVFFVGDYLVFKAVAFVPADLLRILVGFACICGHNWTIFLGFKGGKGVASTLGVLIGLSAKVAGFNTVLLAVLASWLVVFMLWRIVSLASIIAGISIPIYMMLFRQSSEMIVSGVILAVLGVFRHRSNIQRILRGKEPRLDFGGEQ